ncbi:hypothetical protein AAHC03_024366 [Spirometra sp. Aus1]
MPSVNPAIFSKMVSRLHLSSSAFERTLDEEVRVSSAAVPPNNIYRHLLNSIHTEEGIAGREFSQIRHQPGAVKEFLQKLPGKQSEEEPREEFSETSAALAQL